MTMGAGDEFYEYFPDDVGVAFGAPAPQNRWSVAFRPLLIIPQLLAMVVLGAIAVVLTIVGWFAALFLGRLPRPIASYHMNVLAYQARVNAYWTLLTDTYPPFSFTASDYPITVDVRASHVSRLKVFFRWLLFIPAYIVLAAVSGGLVLFGPILWIVTLVRGRMPQPFFSVAAATLRYQTRSYAYFILVTDVYPGGLFGDAELATGTEDSRGDLRLSLSAGAKRLLVVLLIVGLAGNIANIYWQVERAHSPTTSALNRFESATKGFQSGFAMCGSGIVPRAFVCYEHQERVWAMAWDAFGSELSRISFSSSQQAEAAAVIRDAHAVAAALRVTSKETTKAAHDAAYRKAVGLIPGFETDAKALFGHPL